MYGQKAAIRRRKQSRNEYRHLAKLGRPIYPHPDATVAARRLRDLVEAENARRMRQGKKSKK